MASSPFAATTVRVLYVIDGLAPGGTERSTIALAPRLRNMGVDAAIMTLRPGLHDLTAEATANGINVMMLVRGSFMGRVLELRRLLRSGEFDVVHTALFGSDQIGRLAAWGTGVPVISSLVSTPYDRSRLTDPNVRRWKLRLVQAVDAITGRLMVRRFHAVSDGVKIANSRSLGIPMDRIVVAERGRDPALLGTRTNERRRAVREALGIPEEAEVVLNLGRQDHQKGQSILVEAAGLLGTSRPSLVVLIAGKEGSASGDLRRCLARESTASKHVRLLGHRSDIGDLLCAADILVISSHFEGTAGAALEAMCLSTPIVSTDLIGLRGVLQHERNAVLVRPGDPVGLAAGVARVLDDRVFAGQIAEAAHHDFVDRFALDAAAARMRDLYTSVSDGSGL